VFMQTLLKLTAAVCELYVNREKKERT